MRSPHELIEEIGEHRPGSQVELGILRGGERQTLRATLATRESVYGRRYQVNRPTSGSQTDEQQVAARLQSLQQEVQRLGQQLRAIRSQNGAPPYSSNYQPSNGNWGRNPYGGWGEFGGSTPDGGFPLRQWNYLQRHGEANDDPDLFQ